MRPTALNQKRLTLRPNEVLTSPSSAPSPLPPMSTMANTAASSSSGAAAAGGTLSSSDQSAVFVAPRTDDAVKVVVRVRPFNDRELSLHEQSLEGKPKWDQLPIRSIVEFRGNECLFLDPTNEWQEKEKFSFDGCLWSIPLEVQDSDNGFVSQETLFQLYGSDLLSEVWKGFNTCFFAYGQTGSGKTYSMMGAEKAPSIGSGGMALEATSSGLGTSPPSSPSNAGLPLDVDGSSSPSFGANLFNNTTQSISLGPNSEHLGFIPRLCQALFDQIEENLQANSSSAAAAAAGGGENFVRNFRVEVRYMEIYNEMAKDLLFPLSTLASDVKAKINPDNLKIRSTPATGVFVEGLTSVPVDSWQRMCELIEMGNQQRSTAATKMNERSSRSHAIFKITLSQITTGVPKKQFEKPTQHVRSANINLVDLAGSERNKKTGATGDRLKEAASINKSLMCLKNVIDALVDNSHITKAANKKRVPYRDSHLTSILMDSLGGNSKTWMLVCVSPHLDNAEETVQTLRYGARARRIVNSVQVNENASARYMLDLRDELDRMKAELASSQKLDGTSEAQEDLKAQIESHENAIHGIEEEMQRQTEQIATLVEQKKRIAKERHQTAMQALTLVTRARIEKDQAQQEEAVIQARMTELETRLQACESETAAATLGIQKAEANTQWNRERTRQIEELIDDQKRRTTKLEAQRRALQRACEDSGEAIKKLGQERIAALLKCRLQLARCNIDAKRRREDLLAEQEQQKVERDRSQRAMDEKTESHYNALSTSLRQQVDQLDAQNQTIQADIKRMSTEKGSQIAALQQEVHQLQQDLRRKREQNATKTQNLSQEWDRRTTALTADMTKQYHTLLNAWDEKVQEAKAAYQAQQETAAAHHSRMMKRAQDEWKQRLDHATDCGIVMCNDVKEQGTARLAVKEDERARLRAALQKMSLADAPMRDMAYRISTNSEVLQKVMHSRRVSEGDRKLAELALQFAAMYNENRPEPSQLQNLIRASSHGTRCTIAPVLGAETDDAGIRAKSPAARSRSPALSTKANSPSASTMRFGGLNGAASPQQLAASVSSPPSERYVSNKVVIRPRAQHVNPDGSSASMVRSTI